MPAGGTAKFSVNGTNAAKNDTVTFSEAGVYGISVTIVDGGLSVTSSVKVTVAQTLTSISLYSGDQKALVNPNTPLKVTGTSQTLTAMALDQFGNALAIQPSFTWLPPRIRAAPCRCSPPAAHRNRHLHQGRHVRRQRFGQWQRRAGDGLGHISSSPNRRTFAVSQVGGNAAVTRHVGPIHRQPVRQTSSRTRCRRLPRWRWCGRPATCRPGPRPRNSATSGSTTTVNLRLAGTYVLNATQTDSSGDVVSQSITVMVKQTLTSIVVTPGTRQHPGRRDAAIHRPGARPVPAGDGHAAHVHLERQRRHDQFRRPLHGPQHGRHV